MAQGKPAPRRAMEGRKEGPEKDRALGPQDGSRKGCQKSGRRQRLGVVTVLYSTSFVLRLDAANRWWGARGEG